MLHPTLCTFLSTPSARRATQETPAYLPYRIISIHALREEGDRAGHWTGRAAPIFLSTPSARRATPKALDAADKAKISIHALREEGDYHSMIHAMCQAYFYPRPPRGGRLCNCFSVHWHQKFLSTPSARRATDKAIHTQYNRPYFYPRPPRGGRRGFSWLTLHLLNFYPRPPRGGRRNVSRFIQSFVIFLSTPSARRAT